MSSRIICDDSQGFVESWLAQVVPNLFPMNSAVNGFRMVIRQIDFARPESPLKIAVCEDGLALIDRLARRTQIEESHCVEHMGELLHQIESGRLVRVGWRSEIFLKIDLFLLFSVDEHIRRHCQVGIAIVLERSLPVHQPQAASIEENVVRLEQVVMTRCQVRIERRISRSYSSVLSEKFLDIVVRQEVRVSKLLEEPVQGRPFVQQERACRI